MLKVSRSGYEVSYEARCDYSVADATGWMFNSAEGADNNHDHHHLSGRHGSRWRWDVSLTSEPTSSSPVSYERSGVAGIALPEPRFLGDAREG